MIRPTNPAAVNPDAVTWRVRAAVDADLAGLRGLDGNDPPPLGDDETTWVAEPDAGPLAGLPLASLRLRRHIGRPVPRAWFRLGWTVHAAAELGLYRRQRTLLLGNDLTGADELAGWALAAALKPEDAGPAWAALLAAALPATATGEDLHPQPCIAELPGTRDASGRSPVWLGLGSHFHKQDLDAARRQHGPDWVQQVAPLLPRHVLYASLLPASAQEALGRWSAAAEPLHQALQQLGFEWRDHVGIADGGVVLERWPRRA